MATFPAIDPIYPAGKQSGIERSKTTLGDGYESSLIFGLNAAKFQWNLVWLVELDIAEQIEGFLQACSDAGEWFEWKPPDSTIALRFRCDEWTVDLDNPSVYRISAVFRRAFETDNASLAAAPATCIDDVLCATVSCATCVIQPPVECSSYAWITMMVTTGSTVTPAGAIPGTESTYTNTDPPAGLKSDYTSLKYTCNTSGVTYPVNNIPFCETARPNYPFVRAVITRWFYDATSYYPPYGYAITVEKQTTNWYALESGDYFYIDPSNIYPPQVGWSVIGNAPQWPAQMQMVYNGSGAVMWATGQLRLFKGAYSLYTGTYIYVKGHYLYLTGHTGGLSIVYEFSVDADTYANTGTVIATWAGNY